MELGALIASLFATLASTASLVAQVNTDGTSVGTISAGAAVTAAVGALAFVVRSMLKGALVPKNIDQLVTQQSLLLERISDALEESNRREDEHRRWITERHGQ